MVWYVSILSVTAQAIVSFLLARREFRRKLGRGDEQPSTPAVPAESAA